MSIAFRRVIIPESHRHIYGGATVSISVEIVDVVPSLKLTDPTQLPTIALYNPSGVQLFGDTEMSKISTGLYNYLHRTSNANVGRYTANFTAIKSGSVARLENLFLFNLIRVSDFDDVSYLVIADQSSVLWYVIVNSASQLSVSSAIPTFLTKTPATLNAVAIYWMRLLNSLGQQRYIYPDTLGQLNVSPTQPAIGSGVTQSYTWKSENGNNYVVSLNAVDEISIVKV